MAGSETAGLTTKTRTLIVLTIILLICGIACANSDEEIYQLQDISVTPSRFSISASVPSPYIIPKTEMEKLPLIDNDIYRAAHNLPGVVANDFSARFSLRGGDQDEIIVKLDGMELYDPYHLQDFGGAMSVIDMGLVQRADLMTGGFSAKYGDAMSGVFDITSKRPNQKGISGDIGLDLLNTNIILEGTASKAAWLLSARRGYIDFLMDFIETEEVFRPSFYDVYSKTSYDISESDRISAHFLYAGDTNKVDQLDDANDVDSKYWNGMLWARWSHLRSEKTAWNFYLFSGRAGREKYEGLDGIDKRWMQYAGLKGDATYALASSQTLKSGWRWQWSEADYNYYLKEDQTETSVNTRHGDWTLSGYLQDDIQLSSRLAGNVGFRCIYQNYGDYFTAMPRIALAAKMRSDLVVRGAWGLYNQPVSITDLPVEEGIAENQSPEKAIHYVLAAEYTPIPIIVMKTEAYYKTFDDLVGRISDYGRKEQLFTSPESGSARGIEFLLSIQRMPFISPHLPSLSLGYALSRAEVDTEAGEIPRDSDRRHSLSLNADYALFANGWLNVMWRYHTGDPYTEIWYEKGTSDTGEENWQKKFGSINGERYPSYHSLDIRFTKKLIFRKWKLNLYIQVLNLYNRSNVHEYSFDKIVDSNGNITSYDKVAEHFLPILPAIGLSAQFL